MRNVVAQCAFWIPVDAFPDSGTVVGARSGVTDDEEVFHVGSLGDGFGNGTGGDFEFEGGPDEVACRAFEERSETGGGEGGVGG